MADKNYKINIETSKSGDGAERSKEAIDKMAESTDKLNNSNNPLLAGLDQHREKQEALAKAADKAAEALEKEKEAVEKVTAAEQKRNELPPPGEAKAKIHQVDDRSRTDRLIDNYRESGNKVDQLRGKVLKLGNAFKKSNPKVFKLGKMLGRGGIVYAGFKMAGGAIGGFTDKIADYGDKIKSFGDDMEMTGSKGAGLVQWIGEVGQSFEGVSGKINMVLNPIDAYIDATRELADAQRELERVEKEVTAKLKQHLREREIAYEKAAIAAQGRANADARKEDDEYLDEFGKEENRKLDNQEKLTRAKLNRDKTDVISEKERKLTAIDRDDPQASQKRYNVEIEAEKELEGIRKNEFRQLRKIQEERVKIAEIQKGTSARRAKDASQNNTASNGDTLVNDEELARMIEDRKKFIADNSTDLGALDDEDLETYEALIEAVKAQKEIRENLKKLGIASVDEALAIEKNYRKAAEEIGKYIENTKADLNVSEINEKTRRSQQSSSAGNRVIEKQKDAEKLAKKEKKEKRKKKEKKLKKKEKTVSRKSKTSGRAVSKKADELAKKARDNGKDKAAENLEKISIAFADGILEESEKADIAPLLRALNKEKNGSLALLKSIIKKSNDSAEELAKLRQQLKNNRSH